MSKVYEFFIATRAPEEDAKADTSAISIGQYLLACPPPLRREPRPRRCDPGGDAARGGLNRGL